MNSEKKYYKLKLCYSYEKNKKCDKGNYCTYAHGKEELKSYKKECINGLACFKKDCQFSHPKDWNYINNVKTCEYYMNGFCKNGDNCDFIHIKENNNYKVENIKINKKDISSKEENEHNNIFEDEKNEKNRKLHNIEIFVNSKEYNDKNNMLDKSVENDKKEKNFDDIEKLILDFEDIFEKYVKEIKINIDKEFTEDKLKYGIGMKLELNKINSEISLFKHNLKDFIKYNN